MRYKQFEVIVWKCCIWCFFHCIVGSKLYSPAHYKLCHICSQSAKIHRWKTIYIKIKRIFRAWYIDFIFLFSLIWTVMCLCVSNFDNIFKKIADSILFGFLGNLTITGSGHYSGIIVAFLKFSQPTHLYICLIRPLYIKIWMFPKNRKANYFTLFHCAMYRICCLFRFLKLVL